MCSWRGKRKVKMIRKKWNAKFNIIKENVVLGTEKRKRFIRHFSFKNCLFENGLFWWWDLVPIVVGTFIENYLFLLLLIWGIPGKMFLYFHLSKVSSKYILYKILLMTGFELQTIGTGSDRFTHVSQNHCFYQLMQKSVHNLINALWS